MSEKLFEVDQVWVIAKEPSEIQNPLDAKICRRILNKVGKTFVVTKVEYGSVTEVRGFGPHQQVVIKCRDIESDLETIFNRRDFEAGNIAKSGPVTDLDRAKKLVEVETKISEARAALKVLETQREALVSLIK